MMGTCNQCGACCRVLKLEQSPDEVQRIAAVTSVLGIPSDHVFAAAHWHPLTRDEAMHRNPFYTNSLPAGVHLYRCDQLGDDGRCMAYAERPLVCRGYPWYGEPPLRMPLPDQHCSYCVDIVEAFGIFRPEM